MYEKAATAMAEKTISLVLLVLLSLFIGSAMGAKKPYVVYLGGQPDENVDHQHIAESHHELLGSVLGLGRKEAAKDFLYSYTRSMNGFAANLDEEHALALSKLPQVVSVFVSQTRTLQTTRSWEFLGLEVGAGENGTENIPPNSLWRRANFGEDVIIANLDTGVWPESASFDDTGMGPIPSRWKGICQNGTQFGAAQCNRKLIGARYFIKGHEAKNGLLNFSATDLLFFSPRDKGGHGTHTLSTAGGNFVRNASIYGHAEGIAKGGAPRARVATYKVCWPDNTKTPGCDDTDILAAFDAGIHDGVDVFSISLGSMFASFFDYFEDAISIGSFHAVQRGKVVVCSAGNEGPYPGTLSNMAPWIITVGASSIDRQFPSSVLLGNNRTYVGQSLAQFQLPKRKMYPLVSSVDVRAPHTDEIDGKLCLPGTLDPDKVKGKIVVCVRGRNANVEKGETVRMAGGVGMIVCNPADEDVSPNIYSLPATDLNEDDGTAVLDYIKSTPSPVASISSRTELNTKPAPLIGDFSSRGPNTLTPDILKPDITAPGWNILAAYSEAATATGFPFDRRHVPFNLLSGTSMSCPHIAGVAALLKGAYPHWSPAAIKSAIMTTATRMDNTKEAIKNTSLEKAGPFDYGAGHVNPNSAADPGLVYDLSVEDYYSFLCSINYNSTQIKAIAGKAFSCPAVRPNTSDLNYPSITVSELIGSVTVKRSVTYAAEGPAIFKAKMESPVGVSVSVEPEKLEFSETGEKKSFSVAMRARAIKRPKGEYVFGSLTWQDSRYSVVSPIVVNL